MSTNTGVSNGIQQIRKNVIKSDFHKYLFSVVFKISEHPSVFFHLSMWGGRMVGTAAYLSCYGTRDSGHGEYANTIQRGPWG